MITVGTYILKQRFDEYLEYVIKGEKLLTVDGNGNEIIMFKK